MLANLLGPKHQVVDHFIGIGPAVSFDGGQHVPNYDQQFAGNSHDGFTPTNTPDTWPTLFWSKLKQLINY